MLLIIQRSYYIPSTVNMIVLTLSLSSLSVLGIHSAQADSHAVTSASPIGYDSALTGYKSLDGSVRTGWKESNDTVGTIGGWRAYANEAYKANQAEADASKTGSAAAGKGTDAMEPAKTTPVPDTNAARMDATLSQQAMPDSTQMNDSSEMSSAKQLPSPAPLSLSYESAMSNYRVYDDNPPGDWRAANDRVGEIGGWRTYAKEAYEASQQEAKMNSGSGDAQ